MENIKLRLDYKSANNNGWPLMQIAVDDKVIDRIQADGMTWKAQIDLSHGEHVLRVMHYGKNYITDSDPDKFFELTRIWINDVDLKHHVYQFRQTAFLAPWDTQHPDPGSLYLGHNGYLELRFVSPVDSWIKKLFGIDEETMHGQQTTRAVLDDVKNWFLSHP